MHHIIITRNFNSRKTCFYDGDYKTFMDIAIYYELKYIKSNMIFCYQFVFKSLTFGRFEKNIFIKLEKHHNFMDYFPKFNQFIGRPLDNTFLVGNKILKFG